MKKPAKRKQTGYTLPAVRSSSLLGEVRELILKAREGMARTVDAGLTTLYWHIGYRVRMDILKEKTMVRTLSPHWGDNCHGRHPK